MKQMLEKAEKLLIAIDEAIECIDKLNKDTHRYAGMCQALMQARDIVKKSSMEVKATMEVRNMNKYTYKIVIEYDGARWGYKLYNSECVFVGGGSTNVSIENCIEIAHWRIDKLMELHE